MVSENGVFANGKEVRTRAIVLRRTNYGEADRILELITPLGKVAAMAKGVRRERSKMAGGVELFCVSEVSLRAGRGLAVLTGAKMVRFFAGVMRDLAGLELAGRAMRQVAQAAEGVDIPELFEVMEQVLAGIEAGGDLRVIEGWLKLTLARVRGEPVNLQRDVRGEKLKAEERYEWVSEEGAFRAEARGRIGAAEIKLLRLMQAGRLELVLRVKGAGEMAQRVAIQVQ